MTFLINNSPLTEHHILICPDLKGNLSQVLTASAVECGIEVLRQLNDRRYRIGYNSPGAWASVNHLHMHLLKIEEELYIERVVSSMNNIFSSVIFNFCSISMHSVFNPPATQLVYHRH